MKTVPKTFARRHFISEVMAGHEGEIILKGWVLRLRALKKTTFLVLKDASGVIQCVMSSDLSNAQHLRLDDCVEVRGRIKNEERSKTGVEVWVESIRVLNSAENLPFHSTGSIENVSLELQIDYRPLVLRHEREGEIFRLQARLVSLFREFLSSHLFTEIFTSKIVASGTEGGTNLFSLKYFERTAYLAQSPQFYKEQSVAGLERVFETAHVYRAEPHATSRHLAEYYSLDVEMGFIEGPEEIIEVERALLEFAFEAINREFATTLEGFGAGSLPSMAKAPVWEFGECVERLKHAFGTTGLEEDLTPEAERQICQLAEKEFGTPAVFVLGYPLASRPFYTAPRGNGAAQSFDLLFRGLEITTGGQRLHKRSALEAAISGRGLSLESFESHLRMFDLGMPPHGGFAIGAERLTAQILKLANVRQATLYPRDKNRVTP